MSWQGNAVSVRVIDQVWKTSQRHGNQLLVLLALADFADDEGTAFPSMGRLRQKVRLGERAVQYILAELVTSGELDVERRMGRANVYRVTAQGVQPDSGVQRRAPVNGSAPAGATAFTPGVQAHSPLGVQPGAPITVTVKPSIEPSGNRRAPAREPPTQNLTETETTCPMGPHTFTGSYSDHLATDLRHQVRHREPAPHD